MKKTPVLLLAVLALAVFTLPAPADPPNTAILDGRPTEYDGADLGGTFFGAASWGASDVITNLYVTWDAEYLYIALQGWESGNKFAVLLDADPGAGTGATTTTNWVKNAMPYIGYNDVGWQASAAPGAENFGLDFMIASEGYYNNIVRVTYDGAGAPDSNNVEAVFDQGNGVSPRGTPVDMVVQADSTACPLKGFEARIPWSVLYATNRLGEVQPGEVVPQGAQVRVFASLHNNDTNSAYSSPDAIPAQTNAAAGGGWAAGLLTTANYVTYDVDADHDGFPDLAPGDVNAPFLRFVAGVQSNHVVYARFNENVTTNTATNTANWAVNGESPGSVEMLSDATFLLRLTNALPAAGMLVPVAADFIEDASTNSKHTFLCLFPTNAGISTSVTVRFVLQTASGLGRTPGASNFFINGSTEPLEWGYPPATSMPLALIGGPLTSYYRDVTFPPGTGSRVYYKYSGILKNTGTNNFEAIRLQKYADASRWLTLPTDGSSLVVTDYLGVAAHPWRDPNDTNFDFYAMVYTNATRGDAGVRERVTMTFRLDLSGRDLYGVQRVLVVGSDPLRGFNRNGTGIGDWPGNSYVGWDVGGIELVDDGTLGDATAADGVYSRTWSFTTNGLDPAMVGDTPYSLIGGDSYTVPYYGGAWANRRTPRSFAYKYAVVFGAESAVLDPASDVEHYIETGSTNIVLDPYVWANSELPFAPAANPPQLVAMQPVAGGTVVLFTNNIGEAQHGVQFSTNLAQGWTDYGQTAAGSGGNWTVTVENASNPMFFRLYAGAHPFRGVWWEPNPLPETGGTMRIYYTQYSRGLAGDRNVQIAGNFPPSSWGPVPMTFMGDGTWYYDLAVDTNVIVSPNFEFKPRNVSGTVWEGMGGGGDNYRAYRGTLRATWTPHSPTNGGTITITYDQAGGPLAAATNINAHLGFDETWNNLTTNVMANIGGTTWQATIPVPTGATLSVNWVFNNKYSGAVTNWDSPGYGGRDWRAFINK